MTYILLGWVAFCCTVNGLARLIYLADNTYPRVPDQRTPFMDAVAMVENAVVAAACCYILCNRA